MPELPEAETIAATLSPHIKGRRVLNAMFLTPRVANGALPDLSGTVVRDVRRYGKQILWELDRGYLLIQLRMTGLLRWREAPGAYTRARFQFEQGAVCFDDIRQFGSVAWRSAPPDHLGPDPLEISREKLLDQLAVRQRQLKPLLLDQQFLRGLGNIYVDEILFRARLHPQNVAATLGRSRVARLYEAMGDTLRAAIAAGGSSISDYVNADGRPGRFQFQHQVYAKEGKPCPRCATQIERIVVAQRGTHYCPRCQRLSERRGCGSTIQLPADPKRVRPPA